MIKIFDELMEQAQQISFYVGGVGGGFSCILTLYWGFMPKTIVPTAKKMKKSGKEILTQ